jgi:hypothetical protein
MSQELQDKIWEKALPGPQNISFETYQQAGLYVPDSAVTSDPPSFDPTPPPTIKRPTILPWSANSSQW